MGHTKGQRYTTDEGCCFFRCPCTVTYVSDPQLQDGLEVQTQMPFDKPSPDVWSQAQSVVKCMANPDPPPVDYVAVHFAGLLHHLATRCPRPLQVPNRLPCADSVWTYFGSHIDSLNPEEFQNLAINETLWNIQSCLGPDRTDAYDARRHIRYLYIAAVVASWLRCPHSSFTLYPVAAVEQRDGKQAADPFCRTLDHDTAALNDGESMRSTTGGHISRNFKLAPVSQRGMPGTSAKQPRPRSQHKRARHRGSTRRQIR